MGDSDNSTPTNTSPAPAAAIEEDEHDPDLPLTMTASVVLTQLPIDATAALQEAGAFPKPKVTIRFTPLPSSPQLRNPICRISSTARFETVLLYLRRVLKVGPEKGVWCYVNSVFAPGMDEVVGNLHRCFRNQSDDQLVVAYSLTPAFG